MYEFIRSRKKRRLAYFATFVAIVLVGVIVYSAYVFSRIQATLTTEGYISVQVDKLETIADRSIIVLKGECSELTFYISPEQALAIQEGLNKRKRFRPMTHDIIVDILEGLNIKPVMVKIITLSDNTYFAELTLQEWNRFLVVDIRPSDGIAIAVRTDTPIYVNEGLMMKTC
jgi:bifunctional DNase/RNase